LQYLKNIVGYGITFCPLYFFSLNVLFDLRWVKSLDNPHSTIGGCLFLGSSLKSWCSKKQSIVSRSTTKAKYRALVVVTINLCWIQSLLYDLCVFLAKPPTLFCDNINTTYLVANPILHAHTKLIEVDYHFVREHAIGGALHV